MKNRRGEDRIKRNLYLYLNFLETCVLCVLYFNGGRAFPLRDQQICKCIGTKESVSTPIGINWSWLINKDLDDLTSATPMKTYCLEVSIHQNSREWLRRILPPPPPPPISLSIVLAPPLPQWKRYGLNLFSQHFETLTWLHLGNVTHQSLFLLFR